MKETNAEEHIINCFNKFATFEGKASKSEFWFFFLFYVIAQVISYFIDLNIFDAEDGFGVITILVNTILFLPMLAVGARRLHDANKSGWWQLLMVTGVGSIPLMIMWCIDGSTKSYTKDNSTSNHRTKSMPMDEDGVQIFDMEYTRDDYIKRYLPEISKNYNDLLKKHPEARKAHVKNFKFDFKHTDKYWNTVNTYPTNEKNFIEEYFKDRKLDLLEGVWDEENWGLVGIVKEKSFYQIYEININQKRYDKFQKSHLDYSYISGTKGGAFFKTSNPKKFKGQGRVVFILNEDPDSGDVKQYMNQSTSTEVVIKDNNNLRGKLTGFDNRITKFHRAWPLDIEEHNKEFHPTSKSKTKSTKNNITNQLKELKELYKDGTLSKEEFAKAKNKLLN